MTWRYADRDRLISGPVNELVDSKNMSNLGLVAQETLIWTGEESVARVAPPARMIGTIRHSNSLESKSQVVNVGDLDNADRSAYTRIPGLDSKGSSRSKNSLKCVRHPGVRGR